MKAFHLPPSAVLTHSKSTTSDQPEASGQIGFVPTTSICSTRRSQAIHPSDRKLKTHCLVPVNDRPRIVRIPELSARLGLSVSSLYVLIAKGALPNPKPIVPGGRAVGWDSKVIEAWFSARDEASAEVEQ